MKRGSNRFVILFTTLLIVALSSCSFEGGLISKTTWTNQIFGIGSGVAFHNDSEGFTFTMRGNVYSNVSSFTYSYDANTKTGTCHFNNNINTYFTIDGNALNMNGTIYQYDTINNRQ